MSSRPIHLIHIITGLSTGGAEMMLYKLLSRIDRAVFRPEVISLTNIGPVGEKLRELGVSVKSLNLRREWPNPLAVLRLAGLLQRAAPNVIQTWMYHADLIGVLAAWRIDKVPVIWNIRNLDLHPQRTKQTTNWVVKACARLSHRFPTRIVCCSESVSRAHIALGYAADKMVVIPNGFLLDQFQPSPGHYTSVRQELEIAGDTPLIGLIARWHPVKDHGTFINAALKLHTDFPEVHFLLCGNKVTWENAPLVDWIERAGLRCCFHLLGRREDIDRITAALDIATSSSVGEGFPNVIGEAMACGVPCVVTDVGDSAMIVGETGTVVPPQNPEALSQGWGANLKLNPEERRRLGQAARQRIEGQFDLRVIARRYEALYQGLIEHVRH